MQLSYWLAESIVSLLYSTYPSPPPGVLRHVNAILLLAGEINCQSPICNMLAVDSNAALLLVGGFSCQSPVFFLPPGCLRQLSYWLA